MADDKTYPAFDLGCNHCGDVAFHSETGIAYEDEGEKCMSCGFPGHVTINERYETLEGLATAEWTESLDDDAVCNDLTCESCKDYRKNDGN